MKNLLFRILWTLGVLMLASALPVLLIGCYTPKGSLDIYIFPHAIEASSLFTFGLAFMSIGKAFYKYLEEKYND